MKKLVAMMMAGLMLAGMLTGCGGAKNKSYVLLEENFGKEQYGIAFRKGDNALALEVDRLLAEMEDDGSAAKVCDQWFGSDVILKNQEYLDPSIVDNAADGSLQYVLDKGTLVMGLDASFPPMGFMDEKGNIVGFDVDLAKEVASRMGVELVLQPIDWNAKEMELNGKNIDVIWNGMSINEERLAAMTFAKPYLANSQVIIVAEGSDVKSKADLAGKVVGLQEGSTAVEAVEAEPEVMATFAELQKYADNVSAFADLKSGRLDAVVMDEVVARYLLAKDAERK